MDEILIRQFTTYDLPSSLYYHHDGLGSTIALTDSTGSVVESYTYDVFGQPEREYWRRCALLARRQGTAACHTLSVWHNPHALTPRVRLIAGGPSPLCC